MMNLSGQRGFTLVECMVVVAISAMISYGIYAAMYVGESHRETLQEQMNIRESARDAIYKMTQEIRLSAPGRIQISNNGNQIDFQIPDPGNFVLADSSVNWNAAHQIRYARNPDTFQIIRTDMTTGATAIIAHDVVGLNFTGGGANPDQVAVIVRVQRQLSNGRIVPAVPLQVTGQAKIRNA